MISAADAQVVGWPLPASLVERTESMRSRVATFFNAATRDDACTGTKGDLRKTPPSLAEGENRPRRRLIRSLPSRSRAVRITPFASDLGALNPCAQACTPAHMCTCTSYGVSWANMNRRTEHNWHRWCSELPP